jgi:hypothetical protein
MRSLRNEQVPGKTERPAPKPCHAVSLLLIGCLLARTALLLLPIADALGIV